MTSNRTARSTISYLIARDAAHEAAYAKALETLGVNWGKTLPIPKFDAARYPEVKELMDQGIHLTQHHWRLDGSQMGKVFQGPSPNTDVEGTLQVSEEPPRAPRSRWGPSGPRSSPRASPRSWRSLRAR